MATVSGFKKCVAIAVSVVLIGLVPRSPAKADIFEMGFIALSATSVGALIYRLVNSRLKQRKKKKSEKALQKHLEEVRLGESKQSVDLGDTAVKSSGSDIALAGVKRWETSLAAAGVKTRSTETLSIPKAQRKAAVLAIRNRLSYVLDIELLRSMTAETSVNYALMKDYYRALFVVGDTGFAQTMLAEADNRVFDEMIEGLQLGLNWEGKEDVAASIPEAFQRPVESIFAAAFVLHNLETVARKPTSIDWNLEYRVVSEVLLENFAKAVSVFRASSLSQEAAQALKSILDVTLHMVSYETKVRGLLQNELIQIAREVYLGVGYEVSYGKGQKNSEGVLVFSDGFLAEVSEDNTRAKISTKEGMISISTDSVHGLTDKLRVVKSLSCPIDRAI